MSPEVLSRIPSQIRHLHLPTLMIQKFGFPLSRAKLWIFPYSPRIQRYTMISGYRPRVTRIQGIQILPQWLLGNNQSIHDILVHKHSMQFWQSNHISEKHRIYMIKRRNACLASLSQILNLFSISSWQRSRYISCIRQYIPQSGSTCRTPVPSLNFLRMARRRCCLHVVTQTNKNVARRTK